MSGRRSRPCHVLVERLSAYLDGDMSASACDKIRRHAKTCRRCAALIDDLQKTAGLCRRAGREPLPLEVRARARARMLELLKTDTPGTTVIQGRR